MRLSRSRRTRRTDARRRVQALARGGDAHVDAVARDVEVFDAGARRGIHDERLGRAVAPARRRRDRVQQARRGLVVRHRNGGDPAAVAIVIAASMRARSNGWPNPQSIRCGRCRAPRGWPTMRAPNVPFTGTSTCASGGSSDAQAASMDEVAGPPMKRMLCSSPERKTCRQLPAGAASTPRNARRDDRSRRRRARPGRPARASPVPGRAGLRSRGGDHGWPSCAAACKRRV